MTIKELYPNSSYTGYKKFVYQIEKCRNCDNCIRDNFKNIYCKFDLMTQLKCLRYLKGFKDCKFKERE
jgi:hypothetical protein